MKAPHFKISLLAASLAVTLLSGCKNDPTEPTEQEQQYQAYACDSEIYEEAKNLRIYQVMVESFIDGDANADYNTGYGNSQHKGDIQGIINSLDYIKSLGMNAIWLTPIFESVPLDNQSEDVDRLDATGYYASNYFAIDPKFGTLEQTRTLVEEAHAKGLYVFFDGVFGHTKINANQYPSEQGLTLSTTGDAQTDTGRVVEYPEDLEFFKEVAAYWVKELKIDGWRLDQAYQVPVGGWSEIRKAVEEASKSVSYEMNGETVHPMGYMVGEIWDTNGSKIREDGYGNESMPGLCSNFDFPIRYSAMRSFVADESGVNGYPASILNDTFKSQEQNPEFATPNLMLTNHDMLRIGDLMQRAGIAEPEDSEYWSRYKAVYSFMAAYTGPITFYYGEEIGDEVADFAAPAENCVEQGLCDDHVSRSPGKIEGLPSVIGEEAFSANENQADLRDYITKLMKLRADNPALYKGERTHIFTGQDDILYATYKATDTQKIVYITNLSSSPTTWDAEPIELGTQADGKLINMMKEEEISANAGIFSISLAPFEVKFLELSHPSGEVPVTEKPDGGNEGDYTGEGPLANCNIKESTEVGPLGEPSYLRGEFADSNWGQSESRRMRYQGNNLYQVVVHEESGLFQFKLAVGEWSSDYSVEDSSITTDDLGTEMNIASGPNTLINIPVAGDYVYSFQFNEDLTSGKAMVSMCE